MVFQLWSGKPQAQMTSDYAQSRLVLGYNTRIAGNAGRKEARGEGFELATDAWGVLRASQGMLITTEARSGASAPVKDMGETVQRLRQAREQHETLAKLAVQAQAHDQQDQTIRMVSYAEDIDIAALKKNINLLAKLNITQTADSIVIKGAKQLLLSGGDSYIRLENGRVTVGAMQYLVNAQVSNLPPKPMGVNAQGLPAVLANDQRFKVVSPTGEPLPGTDYRMTTSSGTHIFRTGSDGHSSALNSTEQKNVNFELHWDEFGPASGKPQTPVTQS